MLDKRLQLGGLQVGGPRTAQNPARFRIADNVYQTRDGYMVPRSDSSSLFDMAPSGVTSMKNIFRYDDSPFFLGYDGSEFVPFYNSASEVPTAGLPALYGSYGVQSVEKLGNLYLNFPSYGLFKYDGENIFRAGTPMPYYQIPATYLTTPTGYVRVLQSHMDVNGNVVNSGYYQFQARTVTNQLQIRTDKGATPDSNIVRPEIDKASLDNSFNAYFMGPSVSFVYDGGSNTYVVTTGGDHNVVPGIRLIADANAFVKILISGLPVYAISYEVISSTATTVTIGNMKYLDENGDWQDWVGATYFPGNPTRLAYYFMTVWTSSTATGNYVLQGIVPALYESNTNHTFTLDITSFTVSNYAVSTALNLGPNMGDTYDVLSTKSLFPLTSQYLPLCFSTYGDLGLVAYENEIYFSDTTLGGAFEMTNGLAFIVVGEGDDGRVQTVCGTSDFMFVSRQFKNYYLTGNLPTANYRVSEITETSLGAYSNESSISVLDKVIFVNKQGVWALYSGGRCEELSFAIQGLFDNFADTISFSEEAFFDLDDLPTYAPSDTANQWIKLRQDVNKGLLAVAIRGDGEGRILILNLNNGEFYTWSGISYAVASPDFQDICFIDSLFYHTQNGTGSVKIFVENKGGYDYMEDYPAQLHTSWFTAGEPSLEKKLNQLKLWGILETSFPASITHKLDWRDSTEVTDDQYQNDDISNFSHKTRLKPANFQAVSVGISFQDNFQLEGIEIEFQPLQMGMKR